MERADGGQAFPVPGHYPAGMNDMPIDDMRDAANCITKPRPGMTYRMWLTGKIASGVVISFPGHSASRTQAAVCAETIENYVDAIMQRLGLMRTPDDMGEPSHE
jgi:hypothetical protein